MKADSSASRNAMTKTLLDYGFSKVKSKKLYHKDSVISTIKIDKAKNEQIDLYSIDDINLIYEDKLDETFVDESRIFPKNVSELKMTLFGNTYISEEIISDLVSRGHNRGKVIIALLLSENDSKEALERLTNIMNIC